MTARVSSMCLRCRVVHEASAPKVYTRVTLASASTLSGSVLRSLRYGEERPTDSQCSIVCGSSLQVEDGTPMPPVLRTRWWSWWGGGRNRGFRLPSTRSRLTRVAGGSNAGCASATCVPINAFWRRRRSEREASLLPIRHVGLPVCKILNNVVALLQEIRIT